MKRSRRNYRVMTVFGVLALALAAMPLAQADIVVNGNFDNPTNGLLGWVLTIAPSGSDFNVGPSHGALSAPNSANFGAVGNYDDVLSQQLTTVAGGTYVLDFWLAHSSTNNENDFSATWNGLTVLSLVNTNTFGYTEYSYTETATGTSTILAFAGREVPSWYELDNVSVTATATPEPKSVLLLASLLGGLFVFRRLRTA